MKSLKSKPKEMISNFSWLRYSSMYLTSSIFNHNLLAVVFVARIIRYSIIYSLKPPKISTSTNRKSSSIPFNDKILVNNKRFLSSLSRSHKLLSVRVAVSQYHNLDSLVSSIRSYYQLDNYLIIIEDTSQFKFAVSASNLNYYTVFRPSYSFVLVNSIFSNLFAFLIYICSLPWLVLLSKYFLYSRRIYVDLRTQLFRLFFFQYFYRNFNLSHAFFFIGSYGCESEVYSLHSLGCSVVEKLHSHVHIDHFGYKLLFRNHSRETKLIEPDFIVGPKTYSRFFHKSFYLSLPSDNFRPVAMSSTIDTLVIGQLDSSSLIIDFLLHNRSMFPGQIFYKPHPREHLDYVSLESTLSPIVFLHSIDTPLLQIIYDAKSVVCSLSSVLVYLVHFTAKPVFVLAPKRLALRYLGLDKSPLHFNFVHS